MTTLDATSLSGKEHRGPPLLWVPNELLHKIFAYLTPAEAANFRRLDKSIADIGVEYIVPVISLALTEDSFNKLEGVSQHPRIREHVGSMVFDCTYLPALGRENWGKTVAAVVDVAKQYQEKGTKFLNVDSDLEPEARQAIMRTWNSLGHHQYTKDDVDSMFVSYQQYRQEQSQLVHTDAYLQRITHALKEFRSLKNIVIDTNGGCTDVGPKMRKFLAVVMSMANAHRRSDRFAGEAEVHAILDSAHGANLQLERFRCSGLSWLYFSINPRDYASYSESLIRLKSLDLILSTIEDIDESFKCLSTGRVLGFLTAAPDLDRLRFGVFTAIGLLVSESVPYLEHFVGSFHWKLLVQVIIENVQTSVNVFKGFLDRHSSTLKSVELHSLSLVDGKWMSIFRMMRSVLELDAVAFHGDFHEEDDYFTFNAELNVAARSFRRNVHDYIIRATENTQPIEAYLNQYTHHL